MQQWTSGTNGLSSFPRPPLCVPSPGLSVRVDSDGMKIYSAASLGINDKGGDTPLCPFDCECCF